MYSVIFFAAMVIVSGFIAYLGDYIGRSLGKKRLTMLGMRPKHTAIVSTVITGMFISLLALVVLTTVNSQFRQMIFHGQSILKKNERLTFESERLNRANRLLQSEQKRLEADTADKTRAYDRIRKSYEAAQKKYTAAKASYDKSAAEVKRLKTEIAHRRSQLNELKEKNRLSEAQLSEKEKLLENDEKRLAEMEAELAKNEAGLQELLAQVSEQLRQKEAAKKELEQTQKKLVTVQDNLNQAERDLEIAKEAMKEYANLRLSTVIIRQEDEIARGVIDGSRSEPEICGALMQLLANANEICYNIINTYKDVPVDKAGEKEAAIFKKAYVRLVFRDAAGDVYDEDIREMVGSAAHAIKTKGGDSLVTVSSAGNLTSSDLGSMLIPVEFRLHEHNVIYGRSSLVSQIDFPDAISQAEIFTRLYDFYSNTVLTEAVAKGLVPARMSPIFDYYCQRAMEKNPSLRLFSAYRDVSMTEKVETILDLMKSVEEKGPGTSVRLYAARDLYSSDVVTTRNTKVEVVK